MPIGRIGTDFIVNTTTANDQFRPSVTALADGRLLVTWDSFDTGDGSDTCIRGRLFNADGSPAGNDFIVNTTATSFQFDPSVTALADGRLLVTWDSFDTGDGSLGCIRGRLFNADGSAAGNDFIVNTTATNGQLDPSVTALADGRFVVTWESNDPGDLSSGCIRGRLFNADGSPAGNDFIVNTTATDDQRQPSVTALAGGRFVVTWYSFDPGDGSGTCIRGRVFNADGSPAGNDFIVNTTTTNIQLSPSVTALAGGRFVVTWRSDDTGDGDLSCIRGRLFNADGSAAGNDFIVNSTAENGQFTPSVTALSDGRFVVTWVSGDTGDGSGFCIRARLFDADGTPAGNDFIVNTTATNNQLAPSVTALADGRFVVTWRSDDTGDGSLGCIRGQIFDPTIFNGTAADETWKGGNLADRIHGYGGNDTLSGLLSNDLINGDAGNDTLDGGGGNDRLYGGSDDDVLAGGLGQDILFGNGGADRFVFASLKDSGKGALRDQILDFFSGQGDKIDLSLIDAKKGAGNQAFQFIGAQKFHHKAGELRFTDLGAQCVVQGDVNGDGKADFEILVKAATLAKADFLL